MSRAILKISKKSHIYFLGHIRWYCFPQRIRKTWGSHSLTSSQQQTREQSPINGTQITSKFWFKRLNEPITFPNTFRRRTICLLEDRSLSIEQVRVSMEGEIFLNHIIESKSLPIFSDSNFEKWSLGMRLCWQECL